MNWSENTATELETTKNTSLFFEEIANSASVSCPYLSFVSYLNSFDVTQTWFLSLIGSSLVGLAGILPLLIIPLDYTVNNKTENTVKLLRIFLSFAVGGILGDVFLHLLPQVWTYQYPNILRKRLDDKSSEYQHPPLACGLWVLTGLLAFIIIEKIFSGDNDDDGKSTKNQVEDKGHAGPIRIGESFMSWFRTKLSNIHISGYLNLIANSIDNFTNGLAIAGAFMLSTRVGIFTTFAILVHVIPHEIGDFAILLRAGFSRRDAACAQLYTAFGGICGALSAMLFTANSSQTETRQSWILPFTAGAFLHIALVSVLPELVSEKNPKESFKQVISLIGGIAVIAILTALLHD